MPLKSWEVHWSRSRLSCAAIEEQYDNEHAKNVRLVLQQLPRMSGQGEGGGSEDMVN